jgi:putative ABC transport system substrate-binding protein
VRRRTFIAALGGAAEWPLAAWAQQPAPMRRIGVFMPLSADDPEAQARKTAFLQALQALGWTVGRNLQLDYRWGEGNTERYRAYASELAAFGPEVVLAVGTSTVSALQRASRTVPVVFVNVIDPVGGGLVASLARPGGNATGFTSTEFGFGAKWLEVLKEIAPGLTRVAVMRDRSIPSQMGILGSIQSVAAPRGVELRPIDLHETAEMENAVAAFAKEPDGGLIVPSGAAGLSLRERIVALAARYRLPAIYAYRIHVASGGLISYGIDGIDQFRRAAGYVDRILRGEKSADLPVQGPTKFELAINLKTAKMLGLNVPQSLLARADEVIE